MEQIGQILIQRQHKNEPLMQQETSSRSSLMISIDGLRNSVLQKYGQGGVAFLDTYNSDFIFRKQVGVDECFFGEYPTLAQLNKEFDKKFPVVWLMAHLHNLSEYCGCKDKLSGTALNQCAIVIATEYYFLKATELILFFHRFKLGRYDRFYGSIDPLIITASLRTFLKERNDAYDKHAKEVQRLREQESRKEAISWEEYREKYCTSDKPHPFERTTERPSSPKTEEPTGNIMQTAKSIVGDTSMDENTRLQFDRIFKKKYGCTPREYIDNHTKED